MNATIVPVLAPIDSLTQPDMVISIVHDYAGTDELLLNLHMLAASQSAVAWDWQDLVNYIHRNPFGFPKGITAWSVFRTNIQIVDKESLL